MKTKKTRIVPAAQTAGTLPVRVIVIALFGLLAVTVPTVGLAQWQEPSQPPPKYSGSTEIPTLLNGAGVSQQKSGSLMIGNLGAASKLCLNASASGVNDTTNCISAWSQALAASGQSFLRLSTVSSGGANYPIDYPGLDNGYISLKADAAKNQQYSIYVEPDPAAASGRGLYALSDSTSSWAGYFVGRFRVENGGQTAELCLNDTNPWSATTQTGGCISNWTSLIFSGGAIGFVNLQTGPTYSSQGGASAVSGSAVAGSMIAGSPYGLPAAFTCGDGMCTPFTIGRPLPAESATNCPVDCGQVVNPTLSISPWNQSTNVQLTAGTGQPPSGSLAYLLLVRRAGSPPTFQPQQGVVYSAGQVFDNDTVAYSGQVTQGSTQPFNDPGLTNGVQYYYHAYQGNQYPRYAPYTPPVEASATPDRTFQLTVTISGSATSQVTGPGISCPGDCLEPYLNGTSVRLRATPATNCTFAGWSGSCSGTGFCDLVMNQNRSVTAGFSCSGPPPPPPRDRPPPGSGG